jgi:hypothetical protein
LLFLEKQLSGTMEAAHGIYEARWECCPKQHNKNIFKGVTLHLLARIIAWSPEPVEIKLI